MEGKKDFLVMYHGAVVPGRDVERVIELVSINPNIKAVILGNSTEEYGNSLKALAQEYGVEDRVVFHKAVPLKDLWKYVGAVDVGLILARATCKNHLFSLPNKFFENIQAETPVICPNYPAMGYLVDKYQNGLTCNPESLEEINNCIEKIRTDVELYSRLKENARKAKEELCWEKESTVLRNAFQNGILSVG